jgi:hypothetical protein
MGRASRSNLLAFHGRGAMREISLKNYTVKIRQPNEKGELVSTEHSYEVKESIVAMLFIKGQNLKARETLSREALAKRIEDCEEDTILLEESEWNKFREGIEQLTDISRNDIPFVQRILEAPVVLVEKKVE